ncbi:MAG: glycosyltransferase [Firmicutes bacterium]|nr:glycosyltransferase [Bacillota bacterium]
MVPERNPLISVIIPVYNVAKYFARCIESVVRQTYHNLEIIIVDDGSTDQTSAIARKWQNEDIRVVYFWKQNGGVSSARNTGLTLSHGQYIAFLDGDDWLELNALELLWDKMDEFDADLAICDIILEQSYSTRIIRENHLTEVCTSGILEKLLLSEMNPSVSAKLYKASIIYKNNVIFPENVSIGEDLTFNITIGCCSGKAVYIDQPMLHYLRHSASALHNQLCKIRDIEIAIAEIEKILYQWQLYEINKDKFQYLKFMHLYWYPFISTKISFRFNNYRILPNYYTVFCERLDEYMKFLNNPYYSRLNIFKKAVARLFATSWWLSTFFLNILR